MTDEPSFATSHKTEWRCNVLINVKLFFYLILFCKAGHLRFVVISVFCNIGFGLEVGCLFGHFGLEDCHVGDFGLERNFK